MRFLSDENVATSVVHALRNAGHDIFDVKESKLFGKKDSELVTIARVEKRIILTHDSDFVYQNKVPVILLRFRNQRPSNVSYHLLRFLNSSLAKKIRGTIILTELNAEFY